MRNIRVVINDLNPFGNRLMDYREAFNPLPSMPAEGMRIVSSEVLPPLLQALEARGLHVAIGRDLGTVAQLHHASGGRMKRLIQTNDPRFHPGASSADTMVLVLMRGGIPQGCVASRLLWCESNLSAEMESGRFWVTNPATMWTTDDRCIVRAGIAEAIRACHVVFTGSIYLAQEVTGGETLAALLRLHHLWVLCHWRWSWWLGIIEGALARRHIFDVYGATAMHLGLWRTRPGEGSALHKYELGSTSREAAMEGMLRPEMGDLARPMGRPPASLLSFADREGREL